MQDFNISSIELKRRWCKPASQQAHSGLRVGCRPTTASKMCLRTILSLRNPCHDTRTPHILSCRLSHALIKPSVAPADDELMTSLNVTDLYSSLSSVISGDDTSCDVGIGGLPTTDAARRGGYE